MTGVSERLDAIEARATDLTDLCAEHLRQSIRHVQRNCDIDCNVHEDETTWHACNQPDRYDGDRIAAVLADIPGLLDLARKQQAALDALNDWCGRNKTGFYDEAQDDVVQIIRAAITGEGA